jgi:hypothetical protein
MGLKTIIREELKMRKLTWDRKAPQAVPNKRDARRLATRQRGYESIVSSNKSDAAAFTMPGSYRK